MIDTLRISRELTKAELPRATGPHEPDAQRKKTMYQPPYATIVIASSGPVCPHRGPVVPPTSCSHP